MNASFQILISVGMSALLEAPLILDSPFYKQPQTGWVVLSEARSTLSQWVCMPQDVLRQAGHAAASYLPADRPGGCRDGEGRGNTLSLSRFGIGMTSLFPQTFLN